MIWGAYSAASFAQPVELFGRRLRPVTLAQSYALRATENPLYVGAADAQYEAAHVWEAALICSKSRDEIAEMLGGGLSRRDRRWVARRSMRDLGHAVTTLRWLFARYTAGPRRKVWIAEGEDKPGATGRASAIPAEWWIVRRLCAGLGIGISYAWEMGVSEARCYCAAMAEAAGDDGIMSPLDEQVDDMMVRANRLRESGDAVGADAIEREITQLLRSSDG